MKRQDFSLNTKKFFLVILFFPIILVSGVVIFDNSAQATLGGGIEPIVESADALSACSVEIKWKNQGDLATYYEIALAPWNSWTQISATDLGNGNFSFLHKELTPGRNYSYKVRAFRNGVGYSVSSDSESATTPNISAPNSPTSLITKKWEAGGGRLVLSWDQAPELAYGGFRMFRSDTDSNNPSFNKIETVTLTDFITNNREWMDSSITNNTRHFYKVKSYATDEHCAPVTNDTPENSSWVSFSPYSQIITVPSKMTLANTETSENRTKARFSWIDNADETNYEFQLWKEGTPTVLIVNESIRQDKTSYPDAPQWLTFSADQTFNYRVRACAQSGTNNGCSDYTEGVYKSGYTPPQNLASFIRSSSAQQYLADVGLTWGDEGGASHDTRIYRSIDSGNFELLETLSPQCVGNPEVCSYPTTFTDQNVPFDHVYDYEVRFFIDSIEVPSTQTRTDLKIKMILKGQAWNAEGESENEKVGVGYVCFNSDSDGCAGAGEPYSVQIDESGLMSGSAWASVTNGHGWGWLSFNESDLEGCPEAPCKASYNSATKELSGWARFIAVKNFPESSQNKWDGWVKLKGGIELAGLNIETIESFTATLFKKNIFDLLANFLETASADVPEGSYGITFDTETKKFIGKVWAGDVGGWIGFSNCEGERCNVTATVVNKPPEVTNVVLIGPADNTSNSWCGADPSYTVSWTYRDPEGVAQRAFEIQFDKDTTPPTSFRDNKVSGNTSYVLSNPIDVIGGDTFFRARVRAQDGDGTWSHGALPKSWPVSPAEKTIRYLPPLVEFDCDPACDTLENSLKIERGEIEFTDVSQPRGAPGPISRTWTFEERKFAQPYTSTESPVMKRLTSAPAVVKLTRTDANSYNCSLEKSIGEGGEELIKRRIFREK